MALFREGQFLPLYIFPIEIRKRKEGRRQSTLLFIPFAYMHIIICILTGKDVTAVNEIFNRGTKKIKVPARKERWQKKNKQNKQEQ